MLNEPCWITPEELIEVNQVFVAASGEAFLLRDKSLLASACERPKTLWHYDGVLDVLTLAVRLGIGVAANHPFEQGNKRTGFAAIVLLLQANGSDLVPHQDGDEQFADWFIDAVEHKMTESKLCVLLREYVVPLAEGAALDEQISLAEETRSHVPVAPIKGARIGTLHELTPGDRIAIKAWPKLGNPEE